VRRSKLAQFVVVVLVAATVSAYVAYRVGVSRGARSAAETSPLAPAAEPWEEPVGCVDFRDAGKYVGRDACVTGRVLRVATSRAGHTFLDFCPDYRTCPFFSVVFASDREKFGDLGVLRGRQVEIRGFIQTYEGRAEIILNDPKQVRLAE
jgi:hypothetical protein